jgi:hypothetical protein
MDRFGPHATPHVARTLFAAIVFLASCAATRARAEFTTVINSPPDVIENDYSGFHVGSNTQINLYEGAVVPGYSLQLGQVWTSSDNIQLNLEGGAIEGSLQTSSRWASNTNVVINIRSGSVGHEVRVDNGNQLNVYGGRIGTPDSWGGVSLEDGGNAAIYGGEIHGYLNLSASSTATVRGGTITDIAHVYGDGNLEIRGGHIGSLWATNGGRFDLVGGDFRINGTPIPGLSVPGSRVPVTIPERGVLTGVLTDGSAIILTEQGHNSDNLGQGTLSLTSAAVPSAALQIFHAPGAPVPHSLRSGQRLELGEGGVAPAAFHASWGSSIRIEGGEVGPRFRAAGAVIDLMSGHLGGGAVLTMGSVLNVSAGSIGYELTAASGSTVNVTGGVVGNSFNAFPGSTINLAGGVIKPNFFTHEGSSVTISGSGFRVNGSSVTGLGTIGSTRPIEVPAGAVLSGTYADGRPFAFANTTTDVLAAGTITLKSAVAPISASTLIRVPSEPAPVGLRTGQMLFLSDGGDLGDDFNADWGSVVNVEGGRIGENFEAVGALLNITGGEIGSGFHTMVGSIANVSGGMFNGWVHVDKGSAFNLAGGEIAGGLSISNGGVAHVSGGGVWWDVYLSDGATLNVSGGRLTRGVSLYAGSTLNISGGQIGEETNISGGGTAYVSGGAFGDRFNVGDGGRLQIKGSDFRIDGALIESAPNGSLARSITIPAGSVFSGVFQDGTPFAFHDRDGWYGYGDAFEPGSVRVAWDFTPPPAQAPIVDYSGFPAPTGARGGSSLVIDDDHRLGDNFVAGWGSSVTMIGGSIGTNFEAVGSQVIIAGGAVGAEADAFFGSEVTITSGSIGELFTAHEGSTVNVLGGEFAFGFEAAAGSVLNVLGGDFEYGFQRAPGSDVHIVGTNFLVNDVPVPGFGPGQTITFDEYVFVAGILSDGNEFESRLSDYYRTSPTPLARLTLTWTMTADLDGDHDVDAADLAQWRGAPTTGNDFLAWQRQLGSRAAPVNKPVPEPAAWTLVCLSLLALRTRRQLRDR